MNVTEAVNRRKSIRAFLDTPIEDDLLRELVEGAARAPSGGNVQPWRIYVLNGESMARFRNHIADIKPGPSSYEIYPPNLWEPYRTNRFELGELMYAELGIARDDRAGRLMRLAENYTFFGAPAAVFCFVDKGMGPPQWSDLGMYLQTLMLLAQEAGIDSCPQEAWASYADVVHSFVDAPEDEMLFCGVALGHADWSQPVNTFTSPRMEPDQYITWV